MRILVTGGAGFIGSHLVDSLIEPMLGNQVTVWDNLHRLKDETTYHFNRNADYEVVDICKQQTKIGIDHIIHLAALPRLQHCRHDIVRALEVNYAGTVAMANLAVEKAAHFTHISSCVVAEPHLNEYAYSKAQAESYIEYMRHRYSDKPWLSFNIARLGNVYGPRQYDTLISELIEKTWANKDVPILERTVKIHGNGKQTRDYIHVDDVIHGLLRIIQFNNVTCDFGHEVFTVNKLVKMFDCSTKNIDIPIPEMRKVKLNKRKTFKTIGWRPFITMKRYINELKVERLHDGK